MADEETIIREYGTGTPLFRAVVQDDKTIIQAYDTGYPLYTVEGKIGGSVEAMTTAERTAVTPKPGELIWDTDQKVLYAGDGETAGGVQVSGTGGGAYTQGYGIEITGGATISRAAFGTIETVDVSGASPSVTMIPGHAYSINATAKAVTLNVTAFNANQFGIDEAHLEIFVAGTGYVVTGTNVELANALEPDAINYCTVRFVGGVAKIALEDNLGGYIVVSPTGTTAGTLPYALSSATSSYIAFDASLNGSTLDMAGAVTNGEKHVVGNGYSETVLTGGVSCTSKTTFANLSMDGVSVLDGTMTLGDAFIPSGSTVAVSGGGLAVEKVTGNGGMIDLGGTCVVISSGGTAYASGCTFSGGSNTTSTIGGAFYLSATASASFVSCNFTGNSAGAGGGCIAANGGRVTLSGCSFSDTNYAGQVGRDLYISGGSAAAYLDGGNQNVSAWVTNNATAYMGGSNSIKRITGDGFLVISGGAVVDLTGNTIATPVAPSSGITFEGGGATVLYSSGAVSGSYMMDNVTLPAGAKLTNTAVVDLGGGFINVLANATVNISGAYITSGSNADGPGGMNVRNNNIVSLTNCAIVGNTGRFSDANDVRINSKCTVNITGCTLGAFNAAASTDVVTIAGYNYIERLKGLGTINITENATINISGTGASNPVIAGTITFGANVTIVNSAGTEVLLNGGEAGTCGGINADGTLAE